MGASRRISIQTDEQELKEGLLSLALSRQLLAFDQLPRLHPKPGRCLVCARHRPPLNKH
ncbi:hypothetical protein MPL3356_400001 [Mesorhizobium plurifarium]|uniref:Uncharacterized protein n=1 Tax=Mesorhizobium plurifarium TaxID=69974 RepID=A0A090EA43_MESPL|nr:hypothetical protein MPL3356_400001 [Mesorhizobium plurifarium]